MGALNTLYRKYAGLKGTCSFLKIIHNPRDTENIFAMSRSLRSSSSPEEIERIADLVYRDPAIERSFEAQYRPHLPTFKELQAFPEGSFGRAYADFIEKHGLDKDFFPEPRLSTRADYAESRLYQAHDAWHVLTCYTPSVIDELALQAFGVAQYRGPISLLIVAGGLLHILNTDPTQAEPALKAITRGYERGAKAKNLLVEKVLERLGEPLEVVRRDLNIEDLN